MPAKEKTFEESLNALEEIVQALRTRRCSFGRSLSCLSRGHGIKVNNVKIHWKKRKKL